jgi:hypothetical protein
VLRFCGFDLELVVDEVLVRTDWPSICCGRDYSGAQWLIVHTDDNPAHMTWMCARVSDRAMRAIIDGYALPADVLCHSLVGTVELVTLEHGRAVPDRCLLCANVPDHLRDGSPPYGAIQKRLPILEGAL